jgi:hypothetical protein
MSITFINFLYEAASSTGAIKHLTHLAGEEHFYGKARANADLDRLEHLHKFAKGEPSEVSRVGIKADGSPAFEMGHVVNPATGNKEFGVAYKGAAKGYSFNKQDLDEKFGDKPGLHSKLSQVLEHGKKVMSPLDGVVQGDFMGGKKDKTIFPESGNRISTKEQLIKYYVPADSDEGKQLKNAKISLALHTRLRSDQREYNIDTKKFESAHPDVHIFNNKLNKENINYTADHQKKFQSSFNKAKDEFGKLRDHDGLVEGHSEHLQTYINKTVRDGTTPTPAGYKKHLSEKLQKEVDKVKTFATKQRKQTHHDSMVHDVEENKDQFQHLFNAHKHLDNAKNVLLDRLEMSGQNQEHTINGKEAKPEGFVVGYKNGDVSKVVNRSKEGFSGQNLNK